MHNELHQDEAVNNQKEESGEPDEQKGVVALKLQEVSRDQPYSLMMRRY